MAKKKAKAVAQGDLSIRDARPSEKLAEAIEDCDLCGIKIALSEGASLKELPDSSQSPLERALWKCDTAEGVACVDYLIEQGAEFQNLIPEVVNNYTPDTLALSMVKLLFAHAADLNVPNKSGVTALMSALLFDQYDTVKFLMENGADPTIRTSWGSTPLEWLEGRFNVEEDHSEKVRYARYLELVTGNPVPLPDKPPAPEPKLPPPEFQAENERFRIGLEALSYLKLSPDEPDIQPRTTDISNNTRDLLAGDHAELLAAGFAFVGYYLHQSSMSTIAAYAHSQLRLIALNTLDFITDVTRCEIMATSVDGRLFSVVNFSTYEKAEIVPDVLFREYCLDASPKSLADQMSKLVRKHKAKLIAVSPDHFFDEYQSRYRTLVNQLQADSREILATPRIFHHGKPARFERMKSFIDFASWENPSRTSRNTWDDYQQFFDSNTAQSPVEAWNAQSAINDAFQLLKMHHFEFIGASSVTEIMQVTCKIAVGYFERLNGDLKNELIHDDLDRLEQSLLMCQLLGDEATFRRLCQLAPPALASPKLRDSTCPPLAHAQFWMVLISPFRDRAIPRLKNVEQAVTTSRSKRSKELLAALKAIEADAPKALAETITNSLKYFHDLPDPFATNDTWAQIAVAESVLCNIAKQRGITIDLPVELLDQMILA